MEHGESNIEIRVNTIIHFTQMQGIIWVQQLITAYLIPMKLPLNTHLIIRTFSKILNNTIMLKIIFLFIWQHKLGRLQNFHALRNVYREPTVIIIIQKIIFLQAINLLVAMEADPGRSQRQFLKWSSACSLFFLLINDTNCFQLWGFS